MTALRWLAGPDGIAHAHLARIHATACGAPPIGERFAWPATRRCVACIAVLSERDAFLMPDCDRHGPADLVLRHAKACADCGKAGTLEAAPLRHFSEGGMICAKTMVACCPACARRRWRPQDGAR